MRIGERDLGDKTEDEKRVKWQIACSLHKHEGLISNLLDPRKN